VTVETVCFMKEG